MVSYSYLLCSSLILLQTHCLWYMVLHTFMKSEKYFFPFISYIFTPTHYCHEGWKVMKEGILIRWKLRRDASNMKSTFPIIESIKHVRLKVLLGISYASTVPLHVIKMVWKCKHLYWNYFMNVIPKYNIHAHLAHSWIKIKIKSKCFKKEIWTFLCHICFSQKNVGSYV